MKSLTAVIALVLLSLSFVSCSDETIIDDTVPKDFSLIQLRPDEIYIYNGGNPLGTRLDPLLNDSIKVEVNISYSIPSSGTIKFIENEGWFYKPNDNFFGDDNFTYTACKGNECQSTSIKLHVERPIDVSNCTYSLIGETVETTKDQPVEIRIFANDAVNVGRRQGHPSEERGLRHREIAVGMGGWNGALVPKINADPGPIYSWNFRQGLVSRARRRSTGEGQRCGRVR